MVSESGERFLELSRRRKEAEHKMGAFRVQGSGVGVRGSGFGFRGSGFRGGGRRAEGGGLADAEPVNGESCSSLGAGLLLAPQRLPGDELREEFCAREPKNSTDFAALPPPIQEETSARRVIFLKAAQPAQVCRSDLGGVFGFQRGEATGAVDDEIDLDARARPPIK